MAIKRRKDGKLVRRDKRAKNIASATNGRPKRTYIHHGVGSALLKDPLDARSKVGKEYLAHKATLATHVGGDPSTPQLELIDQAARLRVLTAIAWGELTRAKELIKNGVLHPAFEAFLKAARDQRAVLLTLGLKRHAREVRLKEVLEGEVSPVGGEQ